MDGQKLILRKLSSQDADQYNKLLRYAFQVTEKDLLEIGWADEEIKQSKFPVLQRADVWGCLERDEIVSQFAAYPLEMNIHGAIYNVTFVTSVCTYPEYSGHGLMTRLMVHSLTEMREKRQSLALLYPYSIPLYRKRGWEIVSDKMSFRIRDVQLPRPTGPEGYVRRVNWDNPDFISLHSQFARQTHGCLFRNRLAWDEYWRWDEDDTSVALYYNPSGQCLAYMVYLIKEDTMHIKEMIYLNAEGRKGMWKYISAHESMVNEVIGANYSGEPIAFYFDDSDIQETIRPYIMGRIVDVEEFLRNYRCSPRFSGCITLNVSDPLLEWNNKAFHLEFADGRVRLGEAPAEYSASMSIGTLTTLLLGYKRASELAALERITASEQALQLLEHVILHKKPYISDYI